MNKIASRSKRVAVTILGFLLLIEEVGLFAGAADGYFTKLPSNELGANLLLAAFFVGLALSNLLAISVTYFYLIKVLKVDVFSALLWSLIAGTIAPTILGLELFIFLPQEHFLDYFFSPYIFIVGFLTLKRIYAVMRSYSKTR